MITTAKQNRVRISPQKARLVCRLIAGQTAVRAQTLLTNTDKKGARILLKLLNGAISNAANNHAMKADRLYVLRAVANQGPTIKRTLPRAKGSADVIRKRSTNFALSLSDDINENQKLIAATKARIAKRVAGQKKRAEKLATAASKTSTQASSK